MLTSLSVYLLPDISNIYSTLDTPNACSTGSQQTTIIIIIII